jgi:hypothetical protein
MRQRDEIVALIGEAASAGSTRFYLTDRARDLWQQSKAWDDPEAQEVERERIAAVEKLRDAWGRVEIRFPRTLMCAGALRSGGPRSTSTATWSGGATGRAFRSCRRW